MKTLIKTLNTFCISGSLWKAQLKKPKSFMKMSFKLLFMSLAFVPSINELFAQSFTASRLVVLQVGDGSAALSNVATPLFLKEFTTSGTSGISVTIPSTGSTALTMSGSASSEGLITRSSDGSSIIIPGYNAVAGTTAIASSTTTTAPRAIGKVSASGVFSLPATTTSFSGNNARGAASNGTNYWGSGAATGIVLESSGAGTIVSTTSTNTRSLAIYNGNLYFSTGSSTRGIYQVGTGLPTNTGTTSTLLFSTSTSTSSPYQFAFSPSGTTAYVADDATGIYKWTFNGSTWSSVLVNATTCRGLVVDFSGANPIIYATTAATTNSIIKITDIGSGYPLTSSTIATASANTAFRGIAFAPETVVSYPTVNLSVNTNSTSEASQTIVTITATASSAVSGVQTISLGVSGNNITGTDYSLSNSTITIADGATTGTVTFTVQDDSVLETTETAVLTISNPSSGIVLGTPTTQNITITDNDSPVFPKVNLSVSTNSASEAAATVVTVNATASSAVSGDQTVNLGVSGTNITAGDYTLNNAQITILNGATTGSVTFTVVDDANAESTETAVLTISNPSSGLSLDTTLIQNISILDDDFPKIHDIQGSGTTFNSSFSGTQTIEGIVVGVFPGSTKLNGFYVQEEDTDVDANPATSEGIFVYDPSGLFTGTVGTKVRVTGTISDFATTASNIVGTGNSSLTEISASSIINLGASTLPNVTNIVLPVSDFTDLERYEGMLVNVSSTSGPLTVTETFKLGRYDQVGLSGGAVLQQYTQFNAPSVSGYADYISNLQDNYIILDDGSGVQNPEPTIFARGGNPLSASNTLRGGDNIASISGVLDHRYEGYRVQTTTPANFVAANPRLSTPPSVGGTTKAAFFNVLNYFVDLDLGNSINIPNGVSFQPRGANSATEFTRQRDKIVSAITTINADVLGVSEIENDGTASLQDLVNGLNAVPGAGTYAFINDQALVNDPNSAINAVGTDAIKVGIIYKPSVLTPVGSAMSYAEPNPSSPIFSRPPVAQTFVNASGVKFTVVVNHFKSKGSSAGLPGDADQNNGQGFSNATRVAQAQALVSFVSTLQTSSGDSKVLVIGDLNAYAMEDPITTLTTGGLTNLLPNTSYSYQFNGQWGALDHALATPSLNSLVSGATKWHINSDEPVVLDYNTEFKSAGQISSFYSSDGFRSSDHDPVLIGLNLVPSTVNLSVNTSTGTESGATAITVTATASTAVSGDQTVSLAVTGTGITSGDYNLDSTTIIIPNGSTVGSVTFTIVDDASLEGNETATLTITNPSAGISLGATTTQNIAITDNDVTINLCNYVRVGRYNLPEPTRTTAPANNLLAQEVSGVTYNWDSNTLFVVGDGGTAVVEVTKTGQLVSTMTLAPGSSPQGTDFYDPEGITYVGGGKFVFSEERDRQLVQFTYVAGGTLTRATAQTVKIGTFVQNIGIEGLSYDPLTNGFICVKEITPQGIFQTGVDFTAGTATNGSPTTENSTNLFDPTLAGMLDFADVFALSNIPSLSSNGNLLVLSQESGKIVNIDRSGTISSSLNIVSDPGNPLSVAAQQHEGLTMDSDGNLYVVSENGGGDFDHPQIWVYAPSTTPNQAPTAIALSNAVNSIAENSSITSHIKVGDINVTDDGITCNNNATLSGTDASFFEIIGSEVFIKAGTVLDFETKSSYNITLNVDDSGVGSTPDATYNFTLSVTDVVIENAPGVTLIISEVAPWSSGNSPVAADWFELTNTGTNAVTITGWKVDDNSNSFASSVALNGITTIAPGESVIFIESNAPGTIENTFKTNWFGVNAPAGLQIGTYTGSGIGLSTGGDAVNIFNASGEVQAKVVFGSSPAGPSYPTFNNAIGLNNTTISTLSAIGVNDAKVAVNSSIEIGSPGSIGKLYITEVAPWSSGSSPVAADWFEVTNTGANAVDITGWKMDDNSGSAAAAVALNGVTSIAPGESVIFIESNAPSTVVPLFKSTWFGTNPPATLQVGTYTGSGVGLGTGGDAVNLYTATGLTPKASVSFGTSPTGTFRTFDNAAKLNSLSPAITLLSAVGVNGAFIAFNSNTEIGSPGAIVNSPCPTITVTATQNAPIVCNGGTTTITVTATGGVAPVTGLGTFTRGAGSNISYVVTDSRGCTGSATISITQPAALTSTNYLTICSNAVPYSWNGINYSESGTYTKTGLLNSFGCDSTATLVLTIKQTTSSTTSVTDCGSYTWNGVKYTASGTYSTGFINAQGCDSTANLILTINQPTISTTSVTTCGSYVWNGVTYNTSGTYTATGFTNTQGCDSTANLVLTIISTPAAPVVSGNTLVCGTGTTDLTATSESATSYNWYTMATGGTAISTVQIFTSPTLTGTMSKTYYVSATNACGVSVRTKVMIAARPVPALPVISDLSRCGAGTVTLKTSSGKYNFYDASNTLLNLAPTASFIATVSENTTFDMAAVTVVATLNGTCEGPRKTVSVTVNPVPATPSVTNALICGAGDATLTANTSGATSYNWYVAAKGGAAIATGSPYIASYAKTTMRYAESVLGTCKSATRTSATAGVITNLPSFAIAMAACGTTDRVLTAIAPGLASTQLLNFYNAGTVTLQWQMSANGTTGWADISSETGITYTASTTAYYRVQLVTPCGTVSAAKKVTIAATATPCLGRDGDFEAESESISFNATVYPNPVLGEATLYFSGTNSSTVDIVITDANGVEVSRQNNVMANQGISIAQDLSNGVYFVKVIDNGNVKNIRFVKAK